MAYLKQTCQQEIDEFTFNLGQVWLRKYKSLHGIIPKFIDGLYDQNVRGKMQRWRRNEGLDANFSMTILEACKYDYKEIDDIPNFDNLDDVDESENSLFLFSEGIDKKEIDFGRKLICKILNSKLRKRRHCSY